MNRKLYLIRHSYAEEGRGKKDIERNLTHEGQSTVRALGRYLINQEFNPDVILCSTSERTKETGLNLVEELEINEQILNFKEVIYNASVRELLEVLAEVPNEYKSVAIIGHNPTITFFAEYLSGAAIGNMSPCGMVSIKIPKLKWNEVSQGTCIFESYYHPND